MAYVAPDLWSNVNGTKLESTYGLDPHTGLQNQLHMGTLPQFKPQSTITLTKSSESEKPKQS